MRLPRTSLKIKSKLLIMAQGKADADSHLSTLQLSSQIFQVHSSSSTTSTSFQSLTEKHLFLPPSQWFCSSPHLAHSFSYHGSLATFQILPIPLTESHQRAISVTGFCFCLSALFLLVFCLVLLAGIHFQSCSHMNDPWRQAACFCTPLDKGQ